MENQHIVRKFDKNINKIRDQILEMGALVGTQIDDATALWGVFNSNEVSRIRTLDRSVNKLYQDIYARAEILIIRRQPVALDLRGTLAPINIAGELERIGDHAKSFAKRAIFFTKSRPNEDLFTMALKMSTVVQAMLADVLIAYDCSDAPLAAEVRERDLEVDALHQNLLEAAIKSLSVTSGDEDLTAGLVQLILISRNLERVGDHIVNISRYVNQIVEGDDLKATE